jgi:hypothetical protein
MTSSQQKSKVLKHQRDGKTHFDHQRARLSRSTMVSAAHGSPICRAPQGSAASLPIGRRHRSRISHYTHRVLRQHRRPKRPRRRIYDRRHPGCAIRGQQRIGSTPIERRNARRQRPIYTTIRCAFTPALPCWGLISCKYDWLQAGEAQPGLLDAGSCHRLYQWGLAATTEYDIMFYI